ncbi:0599ac91-7c63-472b-b882-512b6f71767c [Thermothielavioides terrestris]|uniref:0599ac91-7c63-472b-b882-512b6f71767c n=1 Tax=Thermothielavioides terrestris TaxID=2587410 RepID=A0A3S4AU96_9PEZI|nr:0599ac91-7c63-472b-b882-512b6f71767c [Thermothielavioides terrestris]
MVRLDLVTALLAATTLAGAVAPNPPAIVPGAYIIEYAEDQDTHAFVAQELGGKASLRKDLRFKLFKGASVQFTDTKNAEQTAAEVAKLPQVKNVYPVRRYPVPKHVVHSTGHAAAESVAKRQADSDTFSTHLMTQVNKFRDAGITGKGIKIAVIDTGTDYLHPALGGCFGPGCLVSYGTDLVGDDFTGENTPKPDPDPLDTCNGHGTHVAGIIAAQTNNPYGIVGAAADVTLGSYRVFGCSGDVGNDILIAAYNMAYEDGSDIITASIGGSSGWSEDPWAAVVSRIVESGVPCTVSAGNDGDAGVFFASTAADGRHVTAIASVDNSVTPALLTRASYTVNGSAASSFGYAAGEPAAWNNISLPLWAVSFNTTDPANGCDPYPDSTPDLSGHIVLVRRGTCTFVQKATNAAAKGAKYVIFYNNVVGASAVSAQVDGIEATAMVTADQGEAWISALQAGSEVVVSMPDPATAGVFLEYFNDTATAGFLSDYTSWGPTFEVEVKPQFATPGGSVLSTFPRALGSYAVLSGTSMACPLAAAVYALLMDARGTKDPRTLENLLSSTAHPNLFRLSGKSLPYLAPVPQQGAGLIQAWDAAQATTLLSVSSLSFNDTDNFNPVQNFSLSNTGSKPVTYTLSNVGAATAYTFANDTTIVPASFPNELTGDFATLAIEPSTFTLPAGHRQVIQVTAAAPKGVDTKRLPVYSGYVAINGSDGSALSLPYLGVAGSLHSAVVLDAGNTFLSRASDNNNTPVRADTTFLLPPPGFANDTAYQNTTQQPKLVVSLTMGSALVRVDVVPTSNCSTAARNATVVFGTRTLGQPDGLPSWWNPRGQLEYSWDGKLDDGSYAPPGAYKLAVKALRIFGDAKDGSEYDAAETVQFRIKYAPAPAKLARSRIKSRRGR